MTAGRDVKMEPVKGRGLGRPASSFSALFILSLGGTSVSKIKKKLSRSLKVDTGLIFSLLHLLPVRS